MNRRILPLLSLLLAVSRLGGASGRADLVGTAALSLEGGYNSNRFADASEAGSSAYATIPSLGVTWFVSPATEIRAGLRYERHAFQEAGFGRRETLTADSTLVWEHDALYVSSRLAARWYKDSALSEDDYVVAGVEPRAWFTSANGHEYFLQGYLARIRYDNALTPAGEALDGLEWDVQPGLALPLSRQTSVSLSGLFKGYSSNDDSDEYTAFGGILELAYRPGRKWRTGTWLRYEHRQYTEQDVETDVPAGDDDRVGLGAWSTWRIQPWLDLFCAANYTTRDNSTDRYTYDSWSARMGVALTGEWAVD